MLSAKGSIIQEVLSRCRWWIFAVAVMVLRPTLATPVGAVEASRCGWDPSCLCITWFDDGGASIEIRCPSGSDDGWTPPDTDASGSSGGGAPPIIDPEGSWDGTGAFDSPGFLLGEELTFDEELFVDDAYYYADRLLRLDPECKALFHGSPLTENAAWLLSKIQFRNGQGMSGCAKKGTAAFVRHPGKHEPIVFLCEAYFESSYLYAGQLLIHELLHVAGQSEDSTATSGPGDSPSSIGIQLVVMKACDSF